MYELFKYLQACSLYQPGIGLSMQNNFARFFKTSGAQYAPLLHTAYTQKNFPLELDTPTNGTTQKTRKTTKRNCMMKVEVHQTTPPIRACAVCLLELRAETQVQKGCVR